MFRSRKTQDYPAGHTERCPSALCLDCSRFFVGIDCGCGCALDDSPVVFYFVAVETLFCSSCGF